MTQTINSEGQAPSVFNNPEFGSVRVIMRDDGEPLFCLKDVCDILDLNNVPRVKERLCEDTVITINGINPKNPEQGVIFVNEDGLYDVILDSRKPEAKKFRKWVTSEVLPSIRKTGSYSVAQPSYQIEDPIARAHKWIEEEKERIALKDQNDEQRHIIKQQNDMIGIMAPKAIAFDDETSIDGWYSGSAAAKLIYGRAFKDGRNKLYEFLREKGVLLRVGRHNMPTGYYMDKGWLKAVWTYDARMKKDVPTPVFSKKGIREIHWMIIGKEMETYKEDLFF